METPDDSHARRRAYAAVFRGIGVQEGSCDALGHVSREGVPVQELSHAPSNPPSMLLPALE